jgi:hypothetical protein
VRDMQDDRDHLYLSPLGMCGACALHSQ